ncbi:hypothetical protein HAV15_011204 [Penicillium sp. str. |nr:hypothetical protein HAV15_011204 [Penicillium sp. str. \
MAIEARADSHIFHVNPKNFLKNLRAPLTVITYLNHFTIQDHMVETLNTVRVEFGRAETWWVNAGNAPV